MSITSIAFYNHYHNGDLFVSKQFVKDLSEKLHHLPQSYFHFNNPRTLLDLPIPYAGTPESFTEHNPCVLHGDVLAVNTWVGAYRPLASFQPQCDPPATGGINLKLLHNIWSHLYRALEPVLGMQLQLSSDIFDYVPRTDYSQYHTASVDQFMKGDRTRVLFCNGAAMSGQSFKENLSEFIDWFANRYPHMDFICTNKYCTVRPNVYFTDDICEVPSDFAGTKASWNQQAHACDLNEIAYLSTFCDVIIGKNSGPFVYCLTANNVNDAGKTFISFNTQTADNLLFLLDTPCAYIQHSDFGIDSMAQVIDSKLCQL